MTPPWFDALVRDAHIRDGLVLYGNTRDLYWTGTDYALLGPLLFERLANFTIHARWDQADGLTFQSDDQARRWDDAVERALAAPSVGDHYDLDEDDEDEPQPTGARRIDLVELLAQYRRVCESEIAAPLLLIEWSNLLVTQPAHPDQQERTWLLQLAKALAGAARRRVDSDTLRRPSGLIVLISPELGAVPPVVYQGEPRVRLTAIPAPSRDERRAFFNRHLDDLVLAKPRGTAASAPRSGVVEALTDLTDQLTTADLLQVTRLSRTTKDPLPPDGLLNLYRFGDQRSPWEELSEARLALVDRELRQRVLGQEGAVSHVATMIVRAWLGLAGLQHSARRSKPKGTLFFVGPTGVGKTELAKACAAFLFGDETACIRFDMSEYNHEHSDQRLVGAPPGYVGFEDGGQLTNAVRGRPFSVLLFDEIEKAHGRVLDKFLQVLEDGRLTDGRGETTWFSETVIIFTSNIGASDIPTGAQTPTDHEHHFRSAVENHFVHHLGRPELLNRLGDNIVVFHPIDDASLRRDILVKKLEPVRRHLEERWGVHLDLDEPVLQRLVTAARTEHGGRGLLNAIERELINPLARYLFKVHAKLRRGRTVRVLLEGRLLEFELVDA